MVTNPYPLSVSFTGTRKGMSPFQKAIFTELIKNPLKTPTEFHHGLCVGADLEAHAIVRATFGTFCQIIGHPGHGKDGFVINPPERVKAFGECDLVKFPLPYLVRDRIMVKSCSYLIACPQTTEEILRSGTWTTVRYARKLWAHKPENQIFVIARKEEEVCQLYAASVYK